MKCTIVKVSYVFPNYPLIVQDFNGRIWKKANKNTYFKRERVLKVFKNGNTESIRYSRNSIVSIKQLEEDKLPYSGYMELI